MFVCGFSSAGADFHTRFAMLQRALASRCLCLVFALGAGSFICNYVHSLFDFMFTALSFAWRARSTWCYCLLALWLSSAEACFIYVFYRTITWYNVGSFSLNLCSLFQIPGFIAQFLKLIVMLAVLCLFGRQYSNWISKETCGHFLGSALENVRLEPQGMSEPENRAPFAMSAISHELCGLNLVTASCGHQV